jgi:hypothetical protein
MNSWLLFVLGFAAAVILYGSYYIYIKEFTCSICGKHYSSRATLVRCPTCKKMICGDNLEKVEEASTTSQRNYEVIPSKKNPKYPCGTAFVNSGKRLGVYCRKDSKHFGFRYHVSVRK